MLLNAWAEAVDFTLPNQAAQRWGVVLDTANEAEFGQFESEHPAGKKRPFISRSFVLLRRIA